MLCASCTLAGSTWATATLRRVWSASAMSIEHQSARSRTHRSATAASVRSRSSDASSAALTSARKRIRPSAARSSSIRRAMPTIVGPPCASGTRRQRASSQCVLPSGQTTRRSRVLVAPSSVVAATAARRAARSAGCTNSRNPSKLVGASPAPVSAATGPDQRTSPLATSRCKTTAQAASSTSASSSPLRSCAAPVVSVDISWLPAQRGYLRRTSGMRGEPRSYG